MDDWEDHYIHGMSEIRHCALEDWIGSVREDGSFWKIEAFIATHARTAHKPSDLPNLPHLPNIVN